MRLARRLTVPAILLTGALVALLVTRPVSTPRLLAIWLLLVAGSVLLVIVRHIRAADAEPRVQRFEDALRRRPKPAELPVELRRTERELSLGISNADHAYRRLLPLLRAAAAARLASGHGVDLVRSPEAARALLGDDAWDVLRPDRPAPEDRHAPGISRRVIAATIARVEAL